MDCSPPGSSCSWNSPNKNTEAGCHSLLQGIFPTQGSNAGLLHCRWILYHLSHQRSPLADTYLAASLASTNWKLKYPPAGASQVAQLLKNLPCNTRDERCKTRVRKIPWRRRWQPAPVFLPGRSHGQRSRWAVVHGVTKSWTWLSTLAGTNQMPLLGHNSPGWEPLLWIIITASFSCLSPFKSFHSAL